ncbi:AMMECR1 domain protein [Candidatus Moduliflexus flocculans]|uniref:AMMECR1 domain protein n=1 Tax=Candidatus Moduliflexus flocculans TaxID=1499966 RepID=A0A0S6VQS9_9BACT|nr:AMMECR1 domain protein [Candidatus Moduliflexus flocculans]
MAHEPTTLRPELQQKLLRIARETIDSYIRTKTIPTFDVSEPELLEKCGAFVTIKRHQQLRGCIGYIEGIKPLWETIVDMAVAASTEDPRFQPMTVAELGDFDLEISVMTPLRKVEHPEEVVVGTHGILLRRGYRSGLLLPQVATEYGWDRETFLAHTCQKAGLPMDAWRDPQTAIYIFSAQVFHEGEALS